MTEEQLRAIQDAIKAGARPVNLMSDLAESRKRNAARLERKHSAAAKRPGLTERQVLMACMDLLDAHPKVALAWRVNVGGVRFGQQYVKFGFSGASDLMGVMVGGKFLAVETKSTGKRPTEVQAAFLENVSKAGGYALCVDDPAYLATWLENI